MSHNPETPYIEEDEIHEFISEHGEALEIIPFVRGQQRDDRLKLSLIRKVSPTGSFLPGRGWLPTTPNSFGLPPGETCPGKTDFCESCYAFGSIRSQGVKQMLDHNFNFLNSLGSVENMNGYLSEMIQRFDEFTDTNEVPVKNKVFRIHWSGDFFSLDYAEAWARTISQFPHINFWVFTRSFREPVDVIPIIDGIENLKVYLSTDEGNINDIPAEYNHLPRANSAVDVVHAQKFARAEHQTVTCPENLDKLKLMQEGEGACIKCRICINGTKDVNFITSGKFDASPRSQFAADISERAVDISRVVLRPVRPHRYITNIDSADSNK